MSEDLTSLSAFSGIVRLFPLPNLVLFPQVIQPLHIFEPRYRQMTRDALSDDRLLGMALLQPEWEKDYLNQPALYPVICVSKIIADQSLEDGRFHLLARGLCRAEVVEELTSDKLYRQARVELLFEKPFQDTRHEKELCRQLVDLTEQWVPNQQKVISQFNNLLDKEIGLALLADLVAFALPLPVEFKQQLLAEADVEKRTYRLLNRLKSKSQRRYPPEFSSN